MAFLTAMFIGLRRFRAVELCYRLPMILNSSFLSEFWYFPVNFRQCTFFHTKPNTTAKCNKQTQILTDKKPMLYMRNIISNIWRILKYSTWDAAQDQLAVLPVRWDSYTVNQTLKMHPPMEKAWLFFNWTTQLKGFKHDQFTYTTMLDIFGEAGRISSMMYLFEQMKERRLKIDVVTYTSILHWLSEYGDFEGAFRIWEEMRNEGLHPTVVSYTTMMKIFFNHNKLKEAGDIFKGMVESKCYPNCYTYTVLAQYLAGAGKLDAALDIMNKMQEAGVQPDKAMCNILVQESARAGDAAAITKILDYMKENCIVLRRFVFLECLQALQLAGASDSLLLEIHPHLKDNEEQALEHGSLETDLLDRVLIVALLERQNFVAIDHIFGALKNKSCYFLDPKLISAIIRANWVNNRLSGALMAFEYCAKIGMKLDRASYTALVGHLIRMMSFQKLIYVLLEMIRVGVHIGTYFICQVICKLGCARMVDSAVKIFDSVPHNHNVATYTALIKAHMQCGNVDEGITLFMIMIMMGIRASSGTFEVLVIGLEEAGRVHEAEIYRKNQKVLRKHEYDRDSQCLVERTCNLLFDKVIPGYVK